MSLANYLHQVFFTEIYKKLSLSETKNTILTMFCFKSEDENSKTLS